MLEDGLRRMEFPAKFQLPLDPRQEVKGVIVDKCKYMDSKKQPLWLVFENAEKRGAPIRVIFKAGDDLRYARPRVCFFALSFTLCCLQLTPSRQQQQ